jgi:hypothetical protein
MSVRVTLAQMPVLRVAGRHGAGSKSSPKISGSPKLPYWKRLRNLKPAIPSNPGGTWDTPTIGTGSSNFSCGGNRFVLAHDRSPRHEEGKCCGLTVVHAPFVPGHFLLHSISLSASGEVLPRSRKPAAPTTGRLWERQMCSPRSGRANSCQPPAFRYANTPWIGMPPWVTWTGRPVRSGTVISGLTPTR